MMNVVLVRVGWRGEGGGGGHLCSAQRLLSKEESLPSGRCASSKMLLITTNGFHDSIAGDGITTLAVTEVEY